MSDRDSFWTTQDGRMVRVRDMTDAHVRNCIGYLEDCKAIAWNLAPLYPDHAFHVKVDTWNEWLECFRAEDELRRAWVWDGVGDATLYLAA